jgi:hypothetical protein
LAQTGDDRGPDLRGELADLLHQRPLADQVGLVHVGHVQDRLGRHQAEAGDGGRLGALQRQLAQGLILGEVGQALADRIDAELGLLVAALGRALGLGERILQGLEVGQHQLDLDGLDVRDRVDRAGDVDHVGVLEAADDLEDRFDLADVAEELVPEPFPLAGPLHDPRDVHEAQGGRDELLGDDVLADARQAVVGDADDPLVRLDGAERIVRALRRLGAGEGVEQRALADVGQTDDTGSHGAEVTSRGWIRTGRRSGPARGGAGREGDHRTLGGAVVSLRIRCGESDGPVDLPGDSIASRWSSGEEKRKKDGTRRVAMHPDEEAAIRAFIAPARRARWLESVGDPARRGAFLDRLNHCADFDERYAVPLPRGGDIPALLWARGAPASCRVISCTEAIDGREMPLAGAIEEAARGGWGTLISCIPGRLAFFYDECGERRFLLERPG